MTFDFLGENVSVEFFKRYFPTQMKFHSSQLYEMKKLISENVTESNHNYLHCLDTTKSKCKKICFSDLGKSVLQRRSGEK